MRHLMLDIETLGTNPGCAILSIAAVEFTNTVIGTTFHEHIDLDSCVAAGLSVEPRTVLWWLDQPKEAQEAILNGESQGKGLSDVLIMLYKRFDWKDLRVWANGAGFDFPILVAAYKAAGIPVPWQYYNEMDYRTMKNIIPYEISKGLRCKPDLAHDALSDALAQAKTLQNIFYWLNEVNDVKRIAA